MNPLTSLTELASPAVVRALGWTLVHALWQGALLAALLRGVLVMTRRAPAATRYTAAMAVLPLLLVLAMGTFAVVYEPTAVTDPATPRITLLTLRDDPPPVGTASVDLAAPGWRDALEISARAAAVRLEPWLPVLVCAWVLGLALMLVRLGGGLLVVHQLRRLGVRPVGVGWQQRLDTLAECMALRRPVALLESVRVAGPVAVGWLRPVVLLPAGLVAGLPVAQLEAVLAHELAHIRRHDYLLNLLQSLIEALFFFHPAVWWVSAQVRREREHCCDDLAVEALGGDAKPLARALAALAAWQSSADAAPAPLPRLSLAATGGALFTRVKRLLVPTPEVAVRPAEGALAGGGAAALALLIVLTTSALLRAPLAANAADGVQAPPIVPMVPAAPPMPPAIAEPSTPPAQLTQVARDSSRRRAPNLIIVKDKKNRLREVYVDGKKVPKDKLGEFQPLVDDAMRDAERTRRAGLQAYDEERRQGIEGACRTFADAERVQALAEARRDLDEARRAQDRDLRIRIHGPLAELNGRVIHLDSLERKFNNEIERAFEKLDFNNFSFSFDSDCDDDHGDVRIERHGGVPPAPPAPPTPPTPAMPPAPPVPPVPTLPRPPKTGDVKARQRYDRQMADYRKQMETYGKKMEEYGRQMEEYGRQQARAASQPRLRNLSRNRSGARTYAFNGDDVRRSSDAQREAADARREAEDARREMRQEMEEAHREMQRSQREAEQAAREAIREAREAEREAREADREAHSISSEELGRALRADGLIGKSDKRFRVSYEDGTFRVNGIAQPDAVKKKYRELLGVPENDRGTSIELQFSDD